MENRPNDTLVSPSDNVYFTATGETLTTPHFDEKSIQSARPAVPLARIKRRRSWPQAVVLGGAILMGGAIGVVVSRHDNRSEQSSTPTLSVAPAGTSQNRSSEPLPQSVDDPEEKANDVRPGAAEGKTEPTRVAQPSDNNALAGAPISDTQEADARETLHSAFAEWIAATNARDIQRQMGFYNPTVNAFYLKRDVPLETIRAEKSRVFNRADLIDIRAAAPGIRVGPDGRTATMLFRKKYAIEGGGENRSGEVLQQLRWRRTAAGWKIVSERDLRVIH